MVLTDQQKLELHQAMLAYLRAAGFTDTYTALKRESNCPTETEDQVGRLETKWTAVVRLQQQVMDLEDKVSSYEEDLRKAGQAARILKRTVTDPAVAYPRAPCKRSLTGHRKGVSRVAVHPDFTVVASASQDGTIKVWDFDSGSLESTLRGHTNTVEDVAFSPSGELLASGSADSTIRLWTHKGDEGYKCTRTLQGHENTVSGVCFTPANDALVSCSRDLSIKVWDLTSGFCKRTLKGHTDWVRHVALNASGTHIASASNDKSVRVWDFESGRCIAQFTTHLHVVERVCFAPPTVRFGGATSRESTEFVVSCSRDNTVRMYDVSSQTQVICFEGHSNWVRDVSFHPLGPYIMSCSDDRTVKMWDVHNKTCYRTLDNAHESFVTCLAMHSSCSAMVTGGTDQLINVWECR